MTGQRASSHKDILRSSSIIGGAAVVNVAMGLLKTKIVALILGPVGLGIIVLLQNLMQTASSFASAGLGQAGTRQVAEANAQGDAAGIALVRRSLLIATTVLALGSAAVVWLASDRFANWLAPSTNAGWQVRWLAIGVALTVATQAQTALLMGFRRVGDLARVSTMSVLVAAIVGIGAVGMWGREGIVAFVLIQAGATFAIGHLYVARLDRAPRARIPLAAVGRQLRAMLAFGAALTVAGVCVNLGQLVARTLIQRELGAAAVGLFQASWLISVTYLGFVLQAMGTDFYPRIVAASTNREELILLVNEQIEVALLLAAPVLFAMMGTAPWLMHLLYARSFDPAVAVLQWQVLGDVLKVASWPLGYLLLAINASRIFMAAEIASITVLVVALWLLMPILGLEASGVSVLVMYGFYLPLVLGAATMRIGFRWSAINARLLCGLFAGCATVFVASRLSSVTGAVLGIVGAMGAAVSCFIRLRNALPGPLGKVVDHVAVRVRHRRSGQGGRRSLDG